MLNVFLIEPGLQMILHFWAFISKSLSQVIIATLWQLKLLGHNYPQYLLFAGGLEITLKKSFLQNTPHNNIYEAKDTNKYMQIAILMQ